MLDLDLESSKNLLTEDAKYFLDLLDALDQEKTSESKRIRLSLIHIIEEYEKEHKHNPDIAKEVLKAQIYGIEVGVCEVLLKSTKKLQKRFLQQSQKTKKPDTKQKMEKGLNKIISAIQTMLLASQNGDAILRKKAKEKMAEAHKFIE